MAIYTHDPKANTLVLNGLPITGFQEGSNVVLAVDGAKSSTQMGVDYHFTRNLMNTSSTLTFTLQKGSPSVTVVDTLVRNNTVADFNYFEPATGTYASGKCYIETDANLNNGAESEGYEYVFRCVDVVKEVYGQGTVPGDVAELVRALI